MDEQSFEHRLSFMLALVDRYPVVAALVIIIVLDIVCGTAVAVAERAVCSTISFRGMCRKAVEIIIVMVAIVLEPFTEMEGFRVPLGKLVALFFLWNETISILEKAAMLGVPIPPIMRETLVKLRASSNPPPAGPAVVNEIHTRGPVVVKGKGPQTQHIEVEQR